HWSRHQRVLEVVKTFRPQIIHGAVFEGMTMAAIGGYFGKVQIIVLEETSYPIHRSKKAIWLQRQFARSADRIIGIAPSVVSFLVEKVGLPDEKVVLINNGVPPPEEVIDVRLEEFN